MTQNQQTWECHGSRVLCNGELIADCVGDDRLANARLIAAAPKLLAAASLAAAWGMFKELGGQTTGDKLREAIQEARES